MNRNPTPTPLPVWIAAAMLLLVVLALPLAYFKEKLRSLAWTVRTHGSASWVGQPVSVPPGWYQPHVTAGSSSMNLHRARWSGRATLEEISIHATKPDTPARDPDNTVQARATRLAQLLNGPGALTYQPTLSPELEAAFTCAAFTRRHELRSILCDARSGPVSGELTTTRVYEAEDLADFSQTLLRCAALHHHPAP